jgi:hypothetical protein
MVYPWEGNLGGAAVKRSCLLLAPILLTTSLWAQTKNPVASVMNEILPRQQKNIGAAVEEVPVDKFSYKPTPCRWFCGYPYYCC